VAAWRHSLDAVDRLRQLVRTERLSCDWSERESLYLAGSAYGHRALRVEAALRAAHTLPGTFLSRRQLREQYGIDRTGALHATGVAVADPVQLTSAILEVPRRLEIRAPVEVHTASSDGKLVALETDHGIVRAATVVFCTGYALLPCLPQIGLSVDSTWAIDSPPRPRYPAWLDRTMVWEASDPYLYVRTTHDGRVIAGGRDEPSAEKHRETELLPGKARGIAKDLARLMGTPIPVDLRWSGAFGSSESGLPVIGPVPGLPGCHVVAGFGGNGITHAMLAAHLLASQLDGIRVSHAGLYRPTSADRRSASVSK
jgi:glycine/D-amino acid oxidase-like deaminating enzyme